MTKTYDVAGIGNAIVDVLAPADDAFLLKHNIAKGVMTLIDEFRAEQLLKVLGKSVEAAGGSAANTMAGIASLGGTGVFIGKVKRDSLGTSFARSMQETGLRYVVPFAEDGPSTACCIIAVSEDGHRSMNTYLGASRELAAGDIDANDVAAAAIVYVEGYLWDSPGLKEAIRKAMAASKAAGG